MLEVLSLEARTSLTVDKSLGGQAEPFCILKCSGDRVRAHRPVKNRHARVDAARPPSAQSKGLGHGHGSSTRRRGAQLEVMLETDPLDTELVIEIWDKAMISTENVFLGEVLLRGEVLGAPPFDVRSSSRCAASSTCRSSSSSACRASRSASPCTMSRRFKPPKRAARPHARA